VGAFLLVKAAAPSKSPDEIAHFLHSISSWCKYGITYDSLDTAIEGDLEDPASLFAVLDALEKSETASAVSIVISLKSISGTYPIHD
jgi:hypothetical protein